VLSLFGELRVIPDDFEVDFVLRVVRMRDSLGFVTSTPSEEEPHISVDSRTSTGPVLAQKFPEMGLLGAGPAAS
jgi:hypothetical protein